MSVQPLSIDVISSPAELGDQMLREINVVVIDVLRATTVIAHALSAGAERIIPAGSVEQAMEFRSQFDPGTALLCGERGGYRVPGFDLGNSPLEYLPHVVQGRTLILASTNGSVLLARCGTARRVLVASFNTLSAVARRMREEGGDWTIVCSGKLGRACLEDLACAGALAASLKASIVETSDAPSDSAGDGLAIALSVHHHHGGDLKSALRNSAHGRYLASIGFEDDLDVCAALDTLDLAPELIDGRIVAEPPPVRAGLKRGGRRVRSKQTVEASENPPQGPAAGT
jgi:2-phosphosulfolactate phosphatase